MVSLQENEVIGSASNSKLDKRTSLLPQTDRLRELQTILRDKETSHSEFVFSADRLIRLVVEEGLNKLPYHKCTVVTPTGFEYEGIKFARGNCGVSVCRSGEAMELALRQCCRSIRIGKVLIGEDQRMLYTRLMTDIARRRVLLLYPCLSSGFTVMKAIQILLENGVQEHKIFLLTVFSTPKSITSIRSAYKKINIITSEICTDMPQFFATKYFGTD
ncbi:uracil phosphoribosyltransferase domain-containing protein [Ditylenchus destructor]|nr:uracil phosphoribosyltransferase domain-containing protein [Ditylenchus destructor]